ncbi:hypothetical protein EC912_103438 [Luteibacter rhizovicinus]|uniref:Uncharacterized protein n=1 Tax=Luteibacter rhizovicinus TaxID=242606 RepID=A0A4R3YPW4_9GAMM|nr:hypothetical protein EC912_103438 [Luteibacter rhizovicinus]
MPHKMLCNVLPPISPDAVLAQIAFWRGRHRYLTRLFDHIPLLGDARYGSHGGRHSANHAFNGGAH